MIPITTKLAMHSTRSGRAGGLIAAISTPFLQRPVNPLQTCQRHLCRIRCRPCPGVRLGMVTAGCSDTITTPGARRLLGSSPGHQHMHTDIKEPGTLSKKETDEFDALFPDLVEDIVGDPEIRDNPIVNQWLSNVFEYNVRGGKKNRGLATVFAYKCLSKEPTPENIRLSFVLGWCTEIMQAYFLLPDDIIDESKVRRGKPCWYRVEGVGLGAFNDAVLLDGSISRLLQKHFQHKDYYVDLFHVMQDASFKTAYGQCLDMRTGLQKRYETYTRELYSTIVKYKASYYTVFLPNALAMIMAGIKDPVIMAQVEAVSMMMGAFYQMQDDFIDCFGDESDIKKVGTDIADGKCSWVMVTALEQGNAQQRNIILENYGKNDKDRIKRVKEVYTKIGIPKLYAESVRKNREETDALIQKIDSSFPRELFYYTLKKLDKQYKLPC